MTNAESKPCGNAEMREDAIGDLFQTAALLLGDEGEAIAVFESALAAVAIDPCQDPESSMRATESLLIRGAIERMVKRDPSAFDPGLLGDNPSVCFETNDLDAADAKPEELSRIVQASGPTRLRAWLEELDGASRAVFVLRGILHQEGSKVAALLSEASGQENWTSGRVGELFRRALCSLANTLAHAPVAA